MNDTYKTIHEIDFFKTIDPADLKNFAAKCRVEELNSREILFNEGTEGDSFYMLIEGALRIFKNSADGEETTIKIINPGEFFAEVILLGRPLYPVSVIALCGSKVLRIQREAFSRLLESRQARESFIAGLFSKMRFLSEKIHHLNSFDVEDRFFKFLIDHYGRHYRYDITIPKKDIASAIGTIPETFSRLILRLTKMEIIAWKQNTLYIKEGFWENSELFD